MTKEEIFERLKAIISEETCVPSENILWDTDLAELTERSVCKRG